MGLTAGIVGLPNVGKSTLFNAITKKNILAANYPFATIEPNVGIVTVPDERLSYLEEVEIPERVVPTSYEFIDIAGLVKGASKGEGLGNKFLSHIREVDAICEVVRCFEDSNITHVEGKVDPIRDIEIIDLELIICDLETVNTRLEKIEKKAVTTKDKEALEEVNAIKKVKEAYEVVRAAAEQGGSVLFVGTKRQISECMKEEAQRCGMYYINSRWLGGTLTNFSTIKKRIARLKQLETMQEDGTFDVLPKKEVLKINKEYDKLLTYFEGIRNMKKLPDAMVIVDPKKEYNAIREAHKLNIPVFGIVDTNADPDDLNYPIPGNDDAVRAINLVFGVLGNAIAEATGKDMVDYISEDDKAEVKAEVKEEKEVKKETKKEEKVEEEKKPAKKVAKKEETKEEKPAKKETKKVAKKEETEDLSKKTVAELKEMAKAKGIEGYTKLKKAELIDALK